LEGVFLLDFIKLTWLPLFTISLVSEVSMIWVVIIWLKEFESVITSFSN
jgi:hypothetical protein